MEKGKKKYTALVVMLMVLIIWSVDFIAIEYMMQFASAGAYTMMRLATGSVILLIAVFIKHGGLKIDRKDWPRIFICGAVAMSLYFTLETHGIKLTSASFGSLILATVPIFGIILDRIFYKSKITGLKVICAAISIVGVYMLVAGDLSYSRLVGLAFTLVAAALWAFQIVYVKPLYDKYDVLTILAGLFISGLIFQIPVTAVSGFQFEVTVSGVVVTVATTVICLVLAEAGYLFAIGNLPVTTVAAFENMIPVMTIILSFILYGTMLTPLQLAGAVLIVGSVMCIALKE